MYSIPSNALTQTNIYHFPKHMHISHKQIHIDISTISRISMYNKPISRQNSPVCMIAQQYGCNSDGPNSGPFCASVCPGVCDVAAVDDCETVAYV